MWIIFKIDGKKTNFFKQEILQKAGSETIFYYPKMIVDKFSKNRLVKKEFKILGDYIFCYNNNFANTKIIDVLKYTKGCKYILDGYLNSQKEIDNFIQSFKKLENKKGYIEESFSFLENQLKYTFRSGPFTDQVFRIIKIQKQNLEILLGNIKISLNKKNFLIDSL
ncbi:hypothetical protein OAB59_00540 [Pelagibacteraceae bacterium]|nr:hypothetical protein [Pelagibacteraceae bacterium]